MVFGISANPVGDRDAEYLLAEHGAVQYPYNLLETLPESLRRRIGKFVVERTAVLDDTGCSANKRNIGRNDERSAAETLRLGP